jgi:hypothetical protein
MDAPAQEQLLADNRVKVSTIGDMTAIVDFSALQGN